MMLIWQVQKGRKTKMNKHKKKKTIAMYLTTRVLTGHPRRIDQHEEVELLLETYIKQVEQR